ERLMMAAVDEAEPAGEPGGQGPSRAARAAFVQRVDRVRQRVRGLRAVVIERGGELQRDVLVERAAEEDVGDLEAAADAEGGETSRAGAREELPLELRALGADLDAGPVEDRLAVTRRMDVGAAAENEAGGAGDPLAPFGGRRLRREDGDPL